MQDISVYTAVGEILNSLVQWDSDVCVYVKNVDVSAACEAHFFNRTMQEAYVVDVTGTDAGLQAKIPNVILREPYEIFGYIRAEESGESKSAYRFRIRVIPRPKPDAYVYSDTDTYVTTKEILDECKEYVASVESVRDDLKGLIESAEDTESDIGAVVEAAKTATQNANEAEAARAAAETARADAETARVAAETQRQKDIQQALADANTAVEVANQVNAASYILDADDNVKYAYSIYAQRGVPHMTLTKIES